MKYKVTLQGGYQIEACDEGFFFNDGIGGVLQIGGLEKSESDAIEAAVVKNNNALRESLGGLLAKKRGESGNAAPAVKGR